MTQRHEVSKCYWKNSAHRLAQCRVATDLQFVCIMFSKKPHRNTGKACISEMRAGQLRRTRVTQVGGTRMFGRCS